MAARPARLIKNRHGIFCLRWVVPLRFRDKSPGATSPREVRISLRTADPQRARILALEFNLALERLKLSMPHHDPRLSAAPFILTVGGMQVDIRDENDRHQFTGFLHDNPDVREEMINAIRSGAASRSEAMDNLVNGVKRATDALAPVASPMLVKDAVEKFVASLTTVGANRRSTAGDKQSTLRMFRENLIEQGCPPDSTYLHTLNRGHLLTFVEAYAARPAKSVHGTKKKEKAAEASAKKEKEAVASAPSSDKPTKKVSPRSVIKVIEHLEGFFDYAQAKNWVASDPVDDAFHKTTTNLRKGAASAKRSNSYALFKESELQRIFEPLVYLKNLNAADDFWAPLIGLYTGARLGEIVTLQVDDILPDPDDPNPDPAARRHFMQVKKIIRGQDEGPKTDNSVRQVPISRELVDLGLLRYVQHAKDQRAEMLFPHRPPNPTRENDPSKHVSAVFAKHLKSVALKSPEKVFHSLRHTVVTRMHVRGVPVSDAELIVGHAAQDFHARMSAAAGQRGGRSSTHIETYIDAEGFSEEGTSLMQRLQQHVDRTLHYPLDFDRLRAAAKIVQELTTRKPNGEFTSGWHTNNQKLGEEMLARLAATPLDDAASTQAAPQTAIA
ncbi:site-specific integrase [Variovorax robiniae]|uniref:Site-specific integrase n=1 Tax=Variovorax robiniae TaxID=1836199 RepID=A0ABU8X7N6_9BURK